MPDDSRYTLKYINKLSTFLRCVIFYTSLVVGLTSTVWLQLMCTNQEYRTVQIRKHSFVFIRMKRNIHTRYLNETPCTILREIYSDNRTLTLFDHWQTPHHLQNSRGKKGGNQGSNQKSYVSNSFVNAYTDLWEWRTFHIVHRVTQLATFLTNIDREVQRLLACSHQAVITTLLATGSIFFLITADSSQYALFCH